MTSRDSNPQLWVTSACSYVDCMLNVLNQETLIQPRYDNCNILWHNIFNKWSYKLVLNIIISKGQVSLALLLLVGGRGGEKLPPYLHPCPWWLNFGWYGAYSTTKLCVCLLFCVELTFGVLHKRMPDFVGALGSCPLCPCLNPALHTGCL